MDGGAERLAVLLAELCGQLELGQRRAQEALAEVRTGGLHSQRGAPAGTKKPHGPVAERAAKQPPPLAGELQERPRPTSPQGAGWSGLSSAGSGGVRALGAAPHDGTLAPDAVPPVESGALGPSPRLSALTPPAEDGEDPGETTAHPTRSMESDQRQSERPNTPNTLQSGSSSKRPNTPNASSKKAGKPVRRQSAGSVLSRLSLFSGSNRGSNMSLNPVDTDHGGNNALDLVKHDSVRSYDLKAFWRAHAKTPPPVRTTVKYNMPWPMREWLSRLDCSSSWVQRRARGLVSSTYYEMGVMMLILANSIFLGYQVEHEARTRQQLAGTLQVEAFFSATFTLELIVKVYALGWSFWIGKEVSWNYFDIFVVASMLLDFYFSWYSSEASSPWSQVSGLRIFRVLRVIRFLRSVRQLKFFAQLRIMIKSIMFSLRPLFWASIILVGMFYVFGIILTQGVLDSLKENDSWDDGASARLRLYFGTLEDSALSLFQAMSGGVNWGDLYDALSPLAVHFRCIFLFFVLFAIFGAANVVTGIFVEIAAHWALNDKVSQKQVATEKRQSSLKRLKELFNELDPGGHGTLTLEGMHEALIDVDSRLVANFHALELEVTDVRTLFLLLDRDRKGFINVDEFLLGCFRLKGEAKTLDIMKLQYQCEWMMHNLVNLVDMLTCGARGPGRDSWDGTGSWDKMGKQSSDDTSAVSTPQTFKSFGLMMARQELFQVLDPTEPRARAGDSWFRREGQSQMSQRRSI